MDIRNSNGLRVFFSFRHTLSSPSINSARLSLDEDPVYELFLVARDYQVPVLCSSWCKWKRDSPRRQTGWETWPPSWVIRQRILHKTRAGTP
ncbi:hypothetical protein M514_24021 [Trichuris suis]|uniref:Uncharacterized protein n=1 Tax=Trichuris suis TaxID=68888 RepID=A0A085N2R7_9BILA|nr:hypothetical protein M514_24021 [Trichuris suis]